VSSLSVPIPQLLPFFNHCFYKSLTSALLKRKDIIGWHLRFCQV
jgi:hypothetical protein